MLTVPPASVANGQQHVMKKPLTIPNRTPAVGKVQIAQRFRDKISTIVNKRGGGECASQTTCRFPIQLCLLPLTDDFFETSQHQEKPVVFSWDDELNRRVAQFQ